MASDPPGRCGTATHLARCEQVLGADHAVLAALLGQIHPRVRKLQKMLEVRRRPGAFPHHEADTGANSHATGAVQKGRLQVA